MMANPLTSLIGGLVWVLLWSVGGWWLVRACFCLRDNESPLAGLALGLVVQAWLANGLAPWLPVMWAFWLGALLTCLVGLGVLAWREGWQGLKVLPRLDLGQVLGFLFLFYLLVSIGRGMAIADDFQNLPLAAMLAVGDIPLHFPLDPAVSYPYHYLNLLMAGQFMRLFALYTWTGVDAARTRRYRASMAADSYASPSGRAPGAQRVRRASINSRSSLRASSPVGKTVSNCAMPRRTCNSGNASRRGSSATSSAACLTTTQPRRPTARIGITPRPTRDDCATGFTTKSCPATSWSSRTST